jgi:hypothetical protein
MTVDAIDGGPAPTGPGQAAAHLGIGTSSPDGGALDGGAAPAGAGGLAPGDTASPSTAGIRAEVDAQDGGAAPQAEDDE